MESGDLSKCHSKAWEAFLRSHGALIKTLSSLMDARCNIGLDTYEVLLNLEQAPDQRMTMGDLANTVMLSPSGVTRLVDRLEKKGYVQRACNPSDKRSYYAILTEDGRREREQAWPAFRDGIREHFVNHLTEEEATALTRILLKFVKKDVGARVHL